ncbi:MAG: PAS domain S-box protein, partial [Nitrospirae bacterium]|nr:PAS domain S-box protein [Nitrospirota bacterium]
MERTSSKQKIIKASFRIALIYAVVGSLWILVSDNLIALFKTDPTALTRVQTYKGWLFIIVTAGLLYLLIKRAEKALRESEERYRILYDNVPTMNFTLDTAGNVVSLNQFAVGELGYQPEELIGRPVLDIFYGEDKPALLKQFGEVLQNPGRDYDGEFRKVHKDGRIVWVREIACTAKDQKGDIVVLVACQDITERRKLEEQLRHMQKMDA